MTSAESAGARRAWPWALALIALTVLVYLPSTRAGFIWDDDAYVVDNATLRSLDGLRAIWTGAGGHLGSVQYYPLVLSSFWLEHQLWGLEPAGYHLVNVLVHALAAVLLWRVLLELRAPGAWLGAALFALHPVMVESVSWITERKNVLSLLFYLAAALAYLRWARPHGDEPGERRGPARLYWAALALFLMALFSKTVTATLPAALLLVVWWRRGRLERRDVVPTLPFFALGIGLGLVTVWAEKVHVGAAGAAFDLSALDRVRIAGRALWFYMAKLAWPAELTFIYPRWDLAEAAGWQLLFPLGFLALVLALFLLRERIGRGPVVAVCFFAGTLVPALGFFDVYPFLYSFVADHFQYHASVGLCALAGAGGALLMRRAPAPGQALAAAALVALGALTWRQQAAYMDLETLWRDTLAKNPEAWIAHNNLANVLMDRGEIEPAIEHYVRAVELEPACASALVNLGNARLARGELPAAVRRYEQALAVLPAFDDPAISGMDAWQRQRARRYLGRALRLLGRCDEAVESLAIALQQEPDTVGEHYDLAACLYRDGRAPESVAHFEAALALDPTAVATLRDLAYVLATAPEVRDPARALELATRAVELAGEGDAQALNALAAAHAAGGDYARALDAAQRALAAAQAAGAAPLAAALREAVERYAAAAR